MLVLFVLGVMSLLWMAVVGALIFAEKVLPFGARLATVLAVCFLVLGLWVATSPGTVPGLTQPAGRRCRRCARRTRRYSAAARSATTSA